MLPLYCTELITVKFIVLFYKWWELREYTRFNKEIKREVLESIYVIITPPKPQLWSRKSHVKLVVVALISGTTGYNHTCFKLGKPEKVLLHLTGQRDAVLTWYFEQVVDRPAVRNAECWAQPQTRISICFMTGSQEKHWGGESLISSISFTY